MKRVKILGVGLSGLTAAINLAKVGYDIDVFERNRDIGMRFHGDLQGLENWSEKDDILAELRQMNVAITFNYTPFSKITVTDGERKEEFEFYKPLFYVVKRGLVPGSLDQSLKQQALELGVRFHFERTVPPSEADIIATGPALEAAWGLAKGIVFKTKTPNLAVGLVSRKTTYMGYSYLLITNGYGCMATVLTDRFDTAQSCFEETKRVFINFPDLTVGVLVYFKLRLP